MSGLIGADGGMHGYIGDLPISQVAGTRREFIATAGQTTFTVSYAVGYVDVFVNGVKLATSDFTATSGSSVTLAQACVLGDVVAVIAWAKGEMLPAADFAPIGRPQQNWLINGDMSIWQRGTGPQVVTAGTAALLADRWIVFAGTQPVTQQRVQFGANAPAPRLTGCDTALQLTLTAGGYLSVTQNIENAQQLNAAQLTFSFYTNRNLGTDPKLFARIDTDGSPASIAIASVQMTGVNTGDGGHYRYSGTVQIPAFTTETFGANSRLLIGLEIPVIPAGTYGGNVNLYGLQVERGAALTNYTRRVPGEELALCQRYYQTLAMSSPGQCTAANAAIITQTFATPMRAAPVWGAGAVNGNVMNATGGTVAVASFANLVASSLGARFQVNVAGGLVAGNATTFFGGQLNYSAEY